MSEPIDYVELPGGDLPATKSFYAQAFGWSFQDYGPEYAALHEAGLDGGFDATKGRGTAPLVILKAADLEGALTRVEAAGGEVVDPIFDFPGGRRFHFRDPAGNVLGVWGE
jgi:predicted enzyme related to lactoylglutathione lyase